MNVVVVRTGMANLASVLAALRRLGVEPELTTDAALVGRADRLVLPGVGAFGAAMSMLTGAGLVEPIISHVRSGRPFLAVCATGSIWTLCSTAPCSRGGGSSIRDARRRMEVRSIR